MEKQDERLLKLSLLLQSPQLNLLANKRSYIKNKRGVGGEEKSDRQSYN
uniref:Uncharacterized protein n=1 Tax=Rhizophora mucronata TaxID=61149 RepID=A0A2P2PN58_RHIMU